MQKVQLYAAKQRHDPAMHTAVSIRRATLADVTTITEMGLRLVSAAHYNALPATDMSYYLRQAFSLAQVKTDLDQSTTHFFLAESKRRIAGMMKLSLNAPPLPDLSQRPLELSRLYLNQNWIGKGVGSALMQYALLQAAQGKHDICWLMVWTGNHHAQDFYRRWGFTIANRLDYPVGQSFLPAYLMIHRITA